MGRVVVTAGSRVRGGGRGGGADNVTHFIAGRLAHRIVVGGKRTKADVLNDAGNTPQSFAASLHPMYAPPPRAALLLPTVQL